MCFFSRLTPFLLLGLLSFLSPFVSSSDENYIRKITNARIEDYPYLVSLRFKDEHRCAGSILSEDKLLTAAHCVNFLPVEHLGVRVGSTVHFEGEYFAIRSVEIHPSYDSHSLDCDIAFVNLDRNLTFGRTVQPIELLETRPIDGTLAASPGWGMMKDSEFYRPDHLKVLTVRLISKEVCRPSYPRDAITKQMICARPTEFRADPCQATQGGPLVEKSSGKQVGVMSWGISCVQPELPNVYATVHNLINSKDV
ncbi:trypsin-7-like [Eupeodes corollae]|uniref:trypsin-7-like n=1 Tax=Eupeodes corollae TaxID=290404 RepID=UPI00249167D9|nr:trypsin-7-like [Eupeodes corollae]